MVEFLRRWFVLCVSFSHRTTDAMTEVLIPVTHLLLSLLVGLTAMGRRPGFLVTFIASLIFTPYLVFLILYVFLWRRRRGAGR